MSKYSSLLPRGVRRFFCLPVSPDRILRELDDEARTHIEMRADEFRALGMSDDEARAEALRRFGDTNEFHAYVQRRATSRARRHVAAEWTSEWMQDVRFALRQFRRNAGLTALIVLTLALGIGANTAIFTIVHRLMLAPLPYPDGNRLVMLAMENDTHGMSQPRAAAVHAWRARARSIESIAAMSIDFIMVQDATEQDTIHAAVTTNFLQLLGIQPALGRGFTPDEARPGSGVAMISYGLWQRKYGGRSDVLGAKVLVDGSPHTIVGVAPPEMGLPISYSPAGSKFRQATPSIWLPGSLDSLEGTDTFARLRSGVSAERASKELQSILDSVPLPPSRFQFQGNGRCCARAVRAQDMLDARAARTIEILFVAVGALLLIACANVANLLMARAWTRRREFAVRRALGAGRGRLMRLVLSESLMLALAGGAIGVVLAWQLLRLIVALRPPALADIAGLRVEPAILFWCVGISVFTGLFFGSAPALFAGGASVGNVLRSETRAGSGDATARRVRSALIISEIALSIVLLAGAGLLVRSFVALQRMPLGFEPHGLGLVDVMFARAPREQLPAQQSAILAHLRAIPGVTDASIGTMPGEPYRVMGPRGNALETEMDGSGAVHSVPSYGTVFMSPSYLHVVGSRLIEGRVPDSTTADLLAGVGGVASATPIEVVVNESLARQLFPNGNALGARLHDADTPRGPGQTSIVVGVVEDVNMPGALRAGGPTMFRLPLAIPETPFVVRTSGSTQTLALELRRAVKDANPGNIAYTVMTGDGYLRDAMAPTTFAMALLAAFSAVALLLSAVGLYGVIAYTVTQRTREIGIRVALGAEPGRVAALVVGGGVKLAAAGAVLGTLAAAASTRVLGGLLFGVSPGDPTTFGAIVLLIVAMSVVACYVPARRAIRVDPMEALRAE